MIEGKMNQRYTNKNIEKKINSSNLFNFSLNIDSNKNRKKYSHIRKSLLEITKEDIKTSNKLNVKSCKIDSSFIENDINDELINFNNSHNNLQNNINNDRNNINNVHNNNEIVIQSVEFYDQEQIGLEDPKKYDNECSSSDISD